MLSVESFVKRCEAAIQEGAPFIAYRHEHGHFFLYYERMLDVWDKETRDWKPKLHKAKKVTIAGLRKEIKKMQKDPKIVGLCVVECNDTGLTVHGGEELNALFPVYVSRNCNTVDN